jgi:AraC-like DNA-binding protein
MYGLLGYATAHSETLGQALERLVALQGVWTEAVRFDLTCEGGAARLAYKSRESVPPKARRQETEQMMATAVAFARDRTMADLRPMSVRFEHEAPPHTQEHSRIFGCALFFGSPVTELSLKADALSLPLAAADLTLGSLIRAQAESVLAARIRQQPMMEVVRSSVAAALAGGQAPALAEAAKAAGFGSRTLQRRLREQDSSWRAVVDEVRITTAKKLLAYSRMSLAQIAFRTGFSQQSALQRAFQRLEGITPRQYRLHAVARQERR